MRRKGRGSHLWVKLAYVLVQQMDLWYVLRNGDCIQPDNGPLLCLSGTGGLLLSALDSAIGPY